MSSSELKIQCDLGSVHCLSVGGGGQLRGGALKVSPPLRGVGHESFEGCQGGGVGS